MATEWTPPEVDESMFVPWDINAIARTLTFAECARAYEDTFIGVRRDFGAGQMFPCPWCGEFLFMLTEHAEHVLGRHRDAMTEAERLGAEGYVHVHGGAR